MLILQLEFNFKDFLPERQISSVKVIAKCYLEVPSETAVTLVNAEETQCSALISDKMQELDINIILRSYSLQN